MANNYFQFKEFKVLQEVCAMKVCTDSCLFGAWVSESRITNKVSKVLDIGTGTGLLSLMLAQQFRNAEFHCVEIDYEASEEAKFNFDNSKWAHRFTVYNQDFNKFSTTEKYDLIICNPPFYSNHLSSIDNKRNAAMHSSDFSLEDMFVHSSGLIADNGCIACLIPYSRTLEVIPIIMRTGWQIAKLTSIKQTEHHGYFRTMLICTKNLGLMNEESIIIKEKNEYSAAFKALLKDYYLYL